jgi:hypothetical protein
MVTVEPTRNGGCRKVLRDQVIVVDHHLPSASKLQVKFEFSPKRGPSQVRNGKPVPTQFAAWKGFA